MWCYYYIDTSTYSSYIPRCVWCVFPFYLWHKLSARSECVNRKFQINNKSCRRIVTFFSGELVFIVKNTVPGRWKSSYIILDYSSCKESFLFFFFYSEAFVLVTGDLFFFWGTHIQIHRGLPYTESDTEIWYNS